MNAPDSMLPPLPRPGTGTSGTSASARSARPQGRWAVPITPADGLYTTECVCRPDTHGWADVDERELASTSRVHWFDGSRLHGHYQDTPPAEHEAAFYAARRTGSAGVGTQWNEPPSNPARVTRLEPDSRSVSPLRSGMCGLHVGLHLSPVAGHEVRAGAPVDRRGHPWRLPLGGPQAGCHR